MSLPGTRPALADLLGLPRLWLPRELAAGGLDSCGAAVMLNKRFALEQGLREGGSGNPTRQQSKMDFWREEWRKMKDEGQQEISSSKIKK